MDDLIKNNAPKDSNMDSMIEKFCTEIKKQPGKDVGTTRRLTVESPYNTSIDSSHNMDRELTELENLIKRLQNEISHMYNDNGGPLENNTSEEPLLANDEDQNKRQTNSHIYHLAVKDGMKTDEGTNDPQKSFESSSKSQLYETFTSIRRNFSLLWDEGKVYEDEIVVKKDEN
ncbi:uncharacterized protein LOC124540496 [Vanessa cardui]|uniref:uncharacterized protein LOC124540496 n=1 Tax=Vanessa cardui TaxID=171605 RepID=UPI001F133D28|nr:uncharacterized protein LOC124540496 [Vanessa cardui]